MLSAWIIAFLPLALAAVLHFWILGANGSTLRWKRLAGVTVGLTIAICGLSLYWLPPAGALADLNAARQAGFAQDIGKLTCAQANDGLVVLKRMTNDQILFRTPDKLLISADVWHNIGSDQQKGLRDLAERHAQCISSGNAPVIVLDIATEQPL